MAIAKMSVAELEKFLEVEFPQMFSAGDIAIESADALRHTAALRLDATGDHRLRGEVSAHRIERDLRQGAGWVSAA